MLHFWYVRQVPILLGPICHDAHAHPAQVNWYHWIPNCQLGCWRVLVTLAWDACDLVRFISWILLSNKKLSEKSQIGASMQFSSFETQAIGIVDWFFTTEGIQSHHVLREALPWHGMLQNLFKACQGPDPSSSIGGWIRSLTHKVTAMQPQKAAKYYLGTWSFAIILASSCFSDQVTRPMGHQGKASCVHSWEWCTRVSAAMMHTPWQSYQPGHLFLMSHPAWAKSLRSNEWSNDRLSPWFILVSSMRMPACARAKVRNKSTITHNVIPLLSTHTHVNYAC